ncbi:uncharacterized protein LOC129793128 [Lutzomyia longipalpis]|uniref:uncharacterized protein LOC129793128 n=1 Tax=Lutzomyia longipalpis TaxID=7200 RepID=UPI0024846A98|nr:uncharacterized protein LOC129793128 [Lutzomyia longipalpis]
MNHLCFIIIALFFLVQQSLAEHPEEKCIRELARTDENCILHCTYSYYGFVDKNFKIAKKHVQKFKKILVTFDAVPKKEKKKLLEHIEACADSANADQPQTKDEKCTKINKYYRCVVDGKILPWNSYADAIIKFDKTLNV